MSLTINTKKTGFNCTIKECELDFSINFKCSFVGVQYIYTWKLNSFFKILIMVCNLEGGGQSTWRKWPRVLEFFHGLRVSVFVQFTWICFRILTWFTCDSVPCVLVSLSIYITECRLFLDNWKQHCGKDDK